MISYIKIDVTFYENSLKKLDFIGSTLRGAFGHSLKKVSCINSSYECESCFAKDNCIYYDFFEKKNYAHNYRFDFELNKNSYDFSLYIFEDSCMKLPYILDAIVLMLEVEGLTYTRERLKVKKMLCNGVNVYKDKKIDLSQVQIKEFDDYRDKDCVSISLKTPLRMKYQGKLLNKKPPLEILLYSILNRINELKKLPKSKLDFTPTYKELSSSIRFEDQTRRSNRQDKKLKIGGIVGELNYEYIDNESLKLLSVAEVVGIGKQTVFGMGKIKLN